MIIMQSFLKIGKPLYFISQSSEIVELLAEFIMLIADFFKYIFPGHGDYVSKLLDGVHPAYNFAYAKGEVFIFAMDIVVRNAHLFLSFFLGIPSNAPNLSHSFRIYNFVQETSRHLLNNAVVII